MEKRRTGRQAEMPEVLVCCGGFSKKDCSRLLTLGTESEGIQGKFRGSAVQVGMEMTVKVDGPMAMAMAHGQVYIYYYIISTLS